jgi:hypothetical protein
MAVAMTASALTTATLRGEEPTHVCVYVDATGEHGFEAERVAALSGAPVVTARTERRAPSEELHAEHLPVLRTFFDHGDLPHTFPSVAGQIPDVAFDEVRVVPNQPETGLRRIRVGDEMPRTLPPGAELVVRPLAGAARVEARAADGEVRTWITSQIRVEQLADVHTVHRDGLCFADLDGVLSITAQPEGLRRYVV